MKRNVIIYKDPAKQADSRIPGSEASLGKREKEEGDAGVQRSSGFFLKRLLFQRK